MFQPDNTLEMTVADDEISPHVRAFLERDNSVNGFQPA